MALAVFTSVSLASDGCLLTSLVVGLNPCLAVAVFFSRGSCSDLKSVGAGIGAENTSLSSSSLLASCACLASTRACTPGGKMGFLAGGTPAETTLFAPRAMVVLPDPAEVRANPALVTLACKFGLIGAPNNPPLGVDAPLVDSLPSVTFPSAV